MIRLLINHPFATLTFIHSKSNAGKAVSNVHHDLYGETDLSFSEDDLGCLAINAIGLDVLFLCIGYGEAITFLQQHRYIHP